MFAARDSRELRKCNDPLGLPVPCCNYRTACETRVSIGLTDLVGRAACAVIPVYPIMMLASPGACFELLLGSCLMRCKGCRYCWDLEGASRLCRDSKPRWYGWKLLKIEARDSCGVLSSWSSKQAPKFHVCNWVTERFPHLVDDLPSLQAANRFRSEGHR
jgi:hypothetical protein